MLATLDEIEGYRPSEPERSLYTRVLTDVTLERRPRQRGVGVFLQRAARPAPNGSRQATIWNT